MATTRRQFIKRSAGLVTLSLVMPRTLFGAYTDPNRRVLVVIELAGGNDGFNTVIPYTDARYFSLRPTLSFKDSDLKDAQGRSTIISDRLGLHPSMGKLKDMFDAGKVAIILGTGYPNPNGSHFASAEIWHTGNPQGGGGGGGEGWLGRYADISLVGKSGLTAIAVEDRLPRTLASTQIVVPSTPNFDEYGLQTDPDYPENRDNKINTLLALHNRSFPGNSFIGQEARIGFDAVNGALQFREALSAYRSTVNYPDNNQLADGLQLLAQVITSIPSVSLLYVQMGGFDHHSNQIPSADNKRGGQHAGLLQDFSDGVDAFYRDLSEHGLADNVVMLQWSEFGRRPEENRSLGTDHGAASSIFVIGNPVKGGLYGRQPSLAVTDLDDAGNARFNLDFRAVYATILDRWLGSDSKTVLGGPFENVGFLS